MLILFGLGNNAIFCDDFLEFFGIGFWHWSGIFRPKISMNGLSIDWIFYQIIAVDFRIAVIDFYERNKFASIFGLT